jgi:hypothetical protein
MTQGEKMTVTLEILALVAVIGLLLGIGALGEKYGKKKDTKHTENKSASSKESATEHDGH